MTGAENITNFQVMRSHRYLIFMTISLLVDSRELSLLKQPPDGCLMENSSSANCFWVGNTISCRICWGS